MEIEELRYKLEKLSKTPNEELPSVSSLTQERQQLPSISQTSFFFFCK